MEKPVGQATKTAEKASQKPTPKRSMRFWSPVQSVILTLSVYFSSQFIASFVILLLPALFGVTQGSLKSWISGAVGQFVFILLVETLVLLMIWGLLRLKKSSFADIGLAWPRLKDIGLAVLGFGVYFMLYLVIAALARALFPSINFEQQQQIGFETARANWELILVFLSLVIMPPLVEEILARGFLYTGLKTKLPIWAATIITSALFAVAHLQFGSNAPLLWVAAIDTFALSLVLIYLREKTGNLGASIALHMLKNGLAFTLLFLFRLR